MPLFKALIIVIVLIVIASVAYAIYREPSAEIPDLGQVSAPGDLSSLFPSKPTPAPKPTPTPTPTQPQPQLPTWTVPEVPATEPVKLPQPPPQQSEPSPSPTPVYTPAPLPTVSPTPTPVVPAPIQSIPAAPDHDTPDPITPTETWVYQCGPQNGGAKCTMGACCSIWGWCGGGKDYCSAATNAPAYNSSTAKVM